MIYKASSFPLAGSSHSLEKILDIRKSILAAITIIAILVSSVCFAQASITEGGVSGQWYNPNRDGEGLFVEIVDSGNAQQISVAWFTYDMDGFQMWLVGNVALEGNPTSVTIPVIVTNGPKFGPDYDKEALNRTSWGTLTLTFADCTTGLLSYASSTGFGSGAVDLIRLTNLTQVRCTDPVQPPSGSGITPGRWSGPQVCFYVAPDGRTLTSEGSTCDEGNAFDSDIDSTLEDNTPCDAEVECRGVIAIVDGSFSCTGHNDKGQIAVGSFWNPTNAAGTAQETEVPSVCTAQWKATPDN
jgi:hypothetical protein